ncbi:RNA polymerase Rpc34, partial [Gonapodya prolifera JEL478]
SLDQNARVVYLNVKLAADRGIAVKQLTARCSLHQKVVQDALKLLEKKGAVKAVKGVKNTIRRLYMLANLKPSAEITGGLWYSDQVLDQEFIEVLADVCHQYVAEHSIPPRAPPGTLYPSTYERYVTLGQIRRHVIESRVLNEIPTRADIRTILNRLCFDGKVERRRVGGSGKGEAFCYKATQQGMQRRKGVIERDAWTDVPCGRCPVFDECWEGGAVSPASCVYYKTWLGKVAKSGTASGVNGVNGANVQNMF